MSAAPAAARARAGEPSGRRLLYAGLGTCLATAILLLALAPRLPLASTDPPHRLSARAVPGCDGSFLWTLDVKGSTGWAAIDLDGGQPTNDSARADLLARRYVLRAPGGALDLGVVSLAEAQVRPGAVWVRDAVVDGVRRNPALAGWFSYSRLTHVVRSVGHTFAVRRRPDGAIGYFRVESYYCVPEGSGCLTVRYRLE